MKPAAVFLFVSFATALAACGDRQEEAATPASAPVAEAPQPDTSTPPPVAEVPPTAEPAPPPETPSAPPASAAPASPPTSGAPTTTTTTTTTTTRADSTVAAQAPKAAPAPAPAPSGATTPPAPSQDLAHGEQIYRKSCAFCHDRGTAGAPKVGDVQAWAPRIAQGVEVLYTNSIKGIRAMPPKGGNPTLAEADVKAAVDYLVAKAR